MTNIDNFRKEDESVDWEAYKNAEIANGDRCFLCNSYIGFGAGMKRLCYPCGKIGDKREFDHNHFIRCPNCGETEDISENDYDLYEEGEHKVTCSNCNYDYEITTDVSYSFTSPELKKLGEK